MQKPPAPQVPEGHEEEEGNIDFDKDAILLAGLCTTGSVPYGVLITVTSRGTGRRKDHRSRSRHRAAGQL